MTELLNVRERSLFVNILCKMIDVREGLVIKRFIRYKHHSRKKLQNWRKLFHSHSIVQQLLRLFQLNKPPPKLLKNRSSDNSAETKTWLLSITKGHLNIQDSRFKDVERGVFIFQKKYTFNHTKLSHRGNTKTDQPLTNYLYQLAASW